MPVLIPVLNVGRAFVDHTLAAQNTAGIIAFIALAAFLQGLAQVLVQAATASEIPPYMPVDRLVADGKASGGRPHSGYLFRAPVLSEELMNIRPLRLGELPPAARGTPANSGMAVGFVRPIAVVLGASVAPYLPGNRAPVPPQTLGNLAAIKSFLAEYGYGYPIVQGELGIRHAVVPNLGGEEKTAVSQITHLIRGLRVALSL